MHKEKIKEQVEEKIKEILEEGINGENLEPLGDLVDIHKDLSNEEYWEIKEEVLENELHESRRIWKKK